MPELMGLVYGHMGYFEVSWGGPCRGGPRIRSPGRRGWRRFYQGNILQILHRQFRKAACSGYDSEPAEPDLLRGGLWLRFARHRTPDARRERHRFLTFSQLTHFKKSRIGDIVKHGLPGAIVRLDTIAGQ